jgi:Superinfection immunity protein
MISLYFVPAIVAWNKQSFGSVMAINFFLGWTLIGWVVALAWALKDPEPPRQFTPAKLCSNCGKYSVLGSSFCASCGSRFAVGG